MAAKMKKARAFYKKGEKTMRVVAEAPSRWSIRQPYSNDASLTYNDKIDETDLWKIIPSASLEEISSFGQIGLQRLPNSLIVGENLLALKYMLEDSNVAGNVRLVYIDPPFSTRQIFRGGNGRTATISASDKDEVAYVDNLEGAEYLEFLRRRLILLREMLSQDGSIYVHIDSKMGHYVKVLMDEIFGKENFINDITRIKCNPKNFSRNGYGNIKDMILFYSKTKDFIWNEPREEMREEDIVRLFPKIDKDGRRYTTTPLHAPGETKNGATGQEWNGLFPPTGRHWRIAPKELNKLEKAGLIEWSSSGNPRKKIFAAEVLSKGRKIQDVWELKDPPYPSYPTEKNIDVLKRIIEASSNHGDLVLDCFTGSGTTLIAAEQLGRRWIGIDNSRIAIDIATRRLKEIQMVSSFTVFSCAEAKGSLNKVQKTKVSKIKEINERMV